MGTADRCAGVEPWVRPFEEAAPDVSETVRRMDARPRLPWLVATGRDMVGGYTFASINHERAAYRWSVDCSIYLARPEHRQGTGGCCTGDCSRS